MTKTVLKGVLKTWKDDRGFGFIQPDQDAKDLFVHISAFKGMARRPLVGDKVFYEIAHEAGGKLKAINARIEGVSTLQTAPKIARKWLWLTAAALGMISAALAAYAYLS
jgi:cold shock CspA family protein